VETIRRWRYCPAAEGRTVKGEGLAQSFQLGVGSHGGLGGRVCAELLTSKMTSNRSVHSVMGLVGSSRSRRVTGPQDSQETHTIPMASPGTASSLSVFIGSCVGPKGRTTGGNGEFEVVIHANADRGNGAGSEVHTNPFGITTGDHGSSDIAECCLSCRMGRLDLFRG